MKLIDVYTRGYQELLRGEPMRGKFRNGWEHPEPFTVGKLTEANFVLPDLNHTFRKGHRIMVQVQSSWFPLTDRNQQTNRGRPISHDVFCREMWVRS